MQTSRPVSGTPAPGPLSRGNPAAILLAILLALLVIAAPVSATATEATRLQAAIADVGKVGSDLGAKVIDIAEAGVRLAFIRDSVGDPATYTDTCRPVAYYIRTMADMLSLGMSLTSVDPVTAHGDLLVGVAMLSFASSPTIAGELQSCLMAA